MPHRVARPWLLAASALMVVGALFHLGILVSGGRGYALLGAPAGLVALVGTGSWRPAASCVVIAALLLLGAAYGFSGAGVLRRLPGTRVVLGAIAAILLARGLVLPALAGWDPQLLRGLCGRCEGVNGFVLVTSALCLAVGTGFAIGAWQDRQAPRRTGDVASLR